MAYFTKGVKFPLVLGSQNLSSRLVHHVHMVLSRNEQTTLLSVPKGMCP